MIQARERSSADDQPICVRWVWIAVAALLLAVTWLSVGPAGGSALAKTTTASPIYDAPARHSSAALLRADPDAASARAIAGSEPQASRFSAHPEAVLIAAETTTEGVDIGATTAHGADRVAGAGATRGGVLTPEQIVQVRGSGQLWTQADGATVRVLQNSAGRYDVVVDGERGLITTFNKLSQKSFDRLANNYGWTP